MKNRKSGVLWWFSELSFLWRVRWQNRTHAVVSHVASFASRRLACKYILSSSQQGKKWSWHNADSFWWEHLWNCCIKSVSHLTGCLPSNYCAYHFCAGPNSTFTVLITLASVMAQSNQSLNECKSFGTFSGEILLQTKVFVLWIVSEAACKWYEELKKSNSNSLM